jgi:2-methylisocitrate lyase-like PEP mutase family enzyme
VPDVTDGSSQRLRDLIQGPNPLLLPGAVDALSAVVIADVGFDAVYLTGAGVSNSFLGLADLGLVTLPEIAAHVERIRDVISLPIVVDADTGFGGPLNVRRTVRMLERRGANAVQIEDQVSPKRCGHFAGVEVVPVGDMVEKLHAATDARMDDDFVIIARTDANESLGLQAAIERSQIYLDHGADVIFVEAPRNEDELGVIGRSVKGPLMVNMVEGGVTPAVSLERLTDMGFSIVLYANSALRAAIHGMTKVLSHLRAHGSTTEVLSEITTWEERQRLVKKQHLIELAERYAERDDGESDQG